VTLPGRSTNILDEEASTSTPSGTDALGVAALAHKGPTDKPVEVRDMTRLVNTFGPEQTYSTLHTYARAFFSHGGARLIVSRYVGATPVKATLALAASSGTSLYVDAVTAGEWGNGASGGLTAEVIAADAARILIIKYGGVEVERSAALTTQAAFVTAFANSSYVRVRVGGGTGLPVVAASASLAGGDTDLTHATDTEAAAALNRIDGDFGCMQVALVDRTSDTAHQALAAHVAAYMGRRFALQDATLGQSVGTLETAATAAAPGDARRFVQLWAPQSPLVEGSVQGTTTAVQSSAVVAGLLARIDRTYGPSQPPIGDLGVTDALSVVVEYGDADRETLNDTGVNVMKTEDRVIKLYSARTLASTVTDQQWVQSSRSREVMRLYSLLDPIQRAHFGRRVDPLGIETGGLARDLEGVLLREWQSGALDGATAEDAYSIQITVDRSDPVTATVTTDISVSTDRFAERLVLNFNHRLGA